MMDDLISRQAAIDAINSGMLTDDDTQFECPSECNSMLEWAVNAVKELPTAEKRGKWEETNWHTEWYGTEEKCSVCGESMLLTDFRNYFPNCGCRMTEGEEDGRE